MRRMAYRKYFNDYDNSLPDGDKFFMIKPIFRKEEIFVKDTALTLTINKQEGLKWLMYDFKKRKWENSYILSTDSEQTKTFTNCLLMFIEYFSYKRINEEVAIQYASTPYSVIKGRTGTNGNELFSTLPNFESKHNKILGSFNKGYIKMFDYVDLFANVRNIIKATGVCYKIEGMPGQVCPDMKLIANVDNKIFLKGMEAKTKKRVQLIAKNNNFIYAEKTHYEDCVYKENNLVINPDFEFGDRLYLMPQYPKLAFQTTITADGKEGDDFIEVESIENVLSGIKIVFSTNKSGFMTRRVVGAKDNKIYVDRPFGANDVPIKNGMAFAEPPIENEKVVFDIARPIKKFSRIVYVKEVAVDFSLLGRKIRFYKGDELVYEAIVNYFSDIDNLIILNEPVDKEIDADKAIIDEYKFVGPFVFNCGEDIPNLYVGEKVFVSGKKYTVAGFMKKTNEIYLKDEKGNITLPQDGDGAATLRVPDEYYKKDVVPFTKLNVKYGKRYFNYVIVEPVEGLKEGAKLKHNEEYSVVEKVEEVEIDKKQYLKVYLKESFVPFVLINKLIFSNYVGDIGYNIDIEKLKNEFQQIKDKYEV